MANAHWRTVKLVVVSCSFAELKVPIYTTNHSYMFMLCIPNVRCIIAYV